MITLHDGPAAGSYAVKRSPLFLRAVIGADGHKDVLDQLTDDPVMGERVYVYWRVGKPGAVHINAGRHGSGFYPLASYRHMPNVDGEQLRGRDDWQAWCRAAAAAPVDPETGEIVSQEAEATQ